jgi:uncharacterized protein YodC (DUF2158 family)
MNASVQLQTEPPLTPRCKKALAIAVKTAKEKGQDYVGPEDISFGLAELYKERAAEALNCSNPTKPSDVGNPPTTSDLRQRSATSMQGTLDPDNQGYEAKIQSIVSEYAAINKRVFQLPPDIRDEILRRKDRLFCDAVGSGTAFTIQAGSVVSLKGGGPTMTVKWVDRECANCICIGPMLTIVECQLPIACLKLAATA